jgi:hypothetical protein
MMLAGFSLLLFLMAHFQKTKSLYPLLGELQEKHDLKPQKWISTIYKYFLGREPYEKELKDIRNKLLQGDSLDDIIEEMILSSDQYAEIRASDFCKHYLEYQSDMLIKKYAKEIKQRSLQEVIIELCSSSEFQSKYNTQTKIYIQHIFEKILNREPTLAELIKYSNLTVTDQGKKAIIREIAIITIWASNYSRVIWSGG